MSIDVWMDKEDGIYVAIRKKGILSFPTTWMKPEDFTLSEDSQGKTYTIWSHLYVESKKKKVKLIETENEWWLPGAGVWAR